MLGMDVTVASALLLSLVSTLLCVGYGWSRWNADGDDDATAAEDSDDSPRQTHGP